MAISPTYPGVYVQEVPSGVRTITGVATSIAAFIDYFTRGPMDRAVQIFNQGDFDREFGGLDSRSEGSYGIQQLFLNGGSQAWVVRVASGAFASADVFIGSTATATAPADATAAAGAAALRVAAANPGLWGNQLAVRVDPVRDRFNLAIAEYGIVNNRLVPVRQEVFRNLSMQVTDPVTGAPEPLYAPTVVNDANTGSKLVTVTVNGTNPPLGNGTFSDRIAVGAVPALAGQIAVSVDIDGATGVARATMPGGPPASIERIAQLLQTAIRLARPDNPAFADAVVSVVEEVDAAGMVTHYRLRALAGAGTPTTRVRFQAVTGDVTATRLRLVAGTGAARVTRGAVRAGGNVNLAVATPEVRVTSGAFNATVPIPGIATAANPATPLADVVGPLQTALRGAAGAPPALAQVTVLAADNRLFVIPGGASATDTITFAESGNPDSRAGALGLVAGAETVTGTRSGTHAADPDLPAGPQVSASIGATSGTGPLTGVPGLPGTAPLASVQGPLQAALRGMVGVGGPATLGEAVVLVAGNQLVVVPGGAPTADQLTFANAGADDAADRLLLTTGAAANVQEYRLGVNTNNGFVADSAQLWATVGANGDPPDGAALIGDPVNKRGLSALDDVDLFNLLCLPRTAQVGGTGNLTATEAGSVIARALAYCERRRAFLILDTPIGVDEVPEIRAYLGTLQPSSYAALYYPRVRIPDPLNAFRLRAMGASGTIAGLFARTDAARGVWKAPAGTEASLRNVPELDDALTDDENGVLNPVGVNCLRTFPIIGRVCWGARTLEGADQLASEWKYVPVRRLALYIEESLYRGTQWAVFEPNDEPLWAQLRLNVGAFMNNLYRKGAFQGSSPDRAYLVKCDSETTTQNDIDLGIVNVVVGFAPLKPAEFVILMIKQLAGQVQT